eukprot:UN18417
MYKLKEDISSDRKDIDEFITCLTESVSSCTNINNPLSNGKGELFHNLTPSKI